MLHINPVRTKMAYRDDNTSSFLGLVAAVSGWLFGKRPAKPEAQELRKADFKISTRRLGVRFTEKIRNVFRFKWIKKI